MLKLLTGASLIASVLLLTACDKPKDTPQSTETKQNSAITISYSDWPGSLVWEIAKEKGWFKEAGLDVDLLWMDYPASLQAYMSGQLLGASLVHGDNLMLASQGLDSNIILVNSVSSGNDVIIAKQGINSLDELKGKSVAVEKGLFSDLLFTTAMEDAKIDLKQVNVVNAATSELSQIFATPNVDAVVLWQPYGLQALKAAPGSKVIYDSTKKPGLIYDVLAVNMPNIEKRKDEWRKLIQVWDKVIKYLENPDTRDDAIQIMAKRANVDPKVLAGLLAGTTFLDLEDNKKLFEKSKELTSIYGSAYHVNEFNLRTGIYPTSPDVDKTIYPELVESLK